MQTKLQQDFDNAYAEFMSTNNITPGHVLVPLSAILNLFNTQHPTLPISMRRFGTKMTGVFYKTQIAVPYKNPITGYFINKAL